MRMSPPIPGTLWRQLSPDHNGDTQLKVDGHVIPQGTYVGVNTYALHHNPVSVPSLIQCQKKGIVVASEDGHI